MSRDGKTAVVVVGGGLAVALWWLLRGGIGGGAGDGLLPGAGLAWALGSGRASGSGGDRASGGGAGGAVTAPPPPPRRCALRLTSHGLTLDGASVTINQAAESCAEIDLVVTGDARQGDLDRLRAALAARRRRVHEKLPGVPGVPGAPATGVALLLPASMRGPRRW